eukprot:698181_1
MASLIQTHHCNIDHRTLRGFLKRILRDAKKSANEKSAMGMHERNQFNLTMQDICDMLQKQQFRCYYSRIPMAFRPNSDWKCSIERLNNRLGYTKDNCVLICWEFSSIDNSV